MKLLVVAAIMFLIGLFAVNYFSQITGPTAYGIQGVGVGLILIAFIIGLSKI